jgi:NTE family protein
MNFSFSGGGLKGYAFIGIVRLIQEKKININGLSGSSIGALVCFLIVLGYTAREMEYLALNLDLGFLEDIQVKILFSDYAINSEEKIITLIRFFLKYKGFDPDINFSDLYDKTKIHLAINATNITDYSQKIFDYINTPLVGVYRAVRASISIPFLWSPEVIEDVSYVDGCLSKSMPIDVFEPDENTMGFALFSNSPKSPPEDIGDYFRKIISCLTHRSNVSELEIYQLKGYTVVSIDTYHVSALGMRISDDELRIITLSAYNKVKDIL